MDLLAIGTALAAKYSALVPPAGETAIVDATSLPQESIPNTPYVLVASALEEAEFTYGGGLRAGMIPFEVTFFLEMAADLERLMARLQKWAPVLLDATLVGVHLGLPDVVAGAWARSFELGTVEYGGQKWAGVVLIVMVQTSEGISPTA
jgi:hypothetical protein